MEKNTLAAIIFSLGLLLLFVLVMPQYDAIKVTKEAVNSRKVVLKETAFVFEKIQELNRQAQSRQADINKIKVFIPEKKQIDEVVSSIQKITEQSGLQLSVLTTAAVPVTSEIGYKKILIGADLVGAYPSFVNFLKLLEQSLRLYDIFEITGAASTTSPGNVNFTIKMNAYYLK
ncbi:MAG: type 4a pilus biogenesis protein PilO [Candidatus Yanofskybacteria bacterium]|nr:type 4a pilus biogenesis protein PilO [Candidatus Yanofskybacteria bacterium]